MIFSKIFKISLGFYKGKPIAFTKGFWLSPAQIPRPHKNAPKKNLRSKIKNSFYRFVYTHSNLLPTNFGGQQRSFDTESYSDKTL